ncbi:conserved Plasmodium protein, unknown function [Plasmodium relictum]|uniref:Uncharacterized protein n=1 Tax=Plasmodium relictum TaxID=85471 RepID=A0A1J1HC01_PLARL|nr:conserved Plasmodium protein, unknown function [Plasmodium relictum]CRH00948.1 conserved Plasmodium protein, unknown function [Plasmodium relictum]
MHTNRLKIISNNSNYYTYKSILCSYKFYSFLRKSLTKKHFNNFQLIDKKWNNSIKSKSGHKNENILSNNNGKIDNDINIFNDKIVITNKSNSNKVFSLYTKTYISKESEQILILSLKKLNEYEKIKENVKISVFIFELQNLSKSKISFNVLKKIEIINNLFTHINNNIGDASPSLLLSVSISYKNINLNKYTYFKNILREVCNHIKVYRSNKLNKLLKNENEKEDYEYTIELLNKKKKNKKKINMLNIYTNNLNNSALCYILYSYSSLFTISNSYLLYICKYILLNVCNINYLDMLSLLYFLNRTNVKIKKSDIAYYKDIELSKLKEKNNSHLENNNDNKNNFNVEDKEMHNSKSNDQNKLVVNKIKDLKNNNNKYNEYKNIYMKILRTIIYIINKKKTYFENSNILILILYYYFKMNLIPIQIFYKLHFKIKKNIKSIDIKYISLYLYILSSIKFSINYYKFIYKYLTNVFQEKIKEFNILSLSLSFYTLSKNQYYNENFVKSCINLFQLKSESLNDINITNIIYTLGKIKIRDDILCNKLCDILIRRIDNISAINLSLIVHNLSKINYKNERFYNICLKKAKELLCSFTLKQLVIFAEGMIINNMYDYEFFEMFFNQLIKLDNSFNQKKKNILNKICFSLVLEKPDFVKNFPLSIKTTISNNINYIQNKNFSDIHDEIINILNYLNIENFEILKKKEPYIFDIFIKNNPNVYIDIISSLKFLKNYNSLNGLTELKKRHMELLNIKYYYFNKSCYLSLDSLDKKVNFIKNFLKNECSLNFNYVNEMKEQKKSEIKNLILFNENQKNYIEKINKKRKFYDKKYSSNNKYSIKNKDFYVFPSCAKTENIEKKFRKNIINKVNFQEPLIKKQQIYIDCDDNILLNERKISLLKNSFFELPKKDMKNSHFQFNNENKFLFEKKCHGLSKHEYYDEKTNKIIIKKII